MQYSDSYTIPIENMTSPDSTQLIQGIAIKAHFRIQQIQDNLLVLKSFPKPRYIHQFCQEAETHGYSCRLAFRKVIIELLKAEIDKYLKKKQRLPLHQYLTTIAPAKWNHTYADLSRIFEATEGTTLEKFIILRRIEEAKLLLGTKLEIKEIASYLGFTNSQHLSAQFKRYTGTSLKTYKQRHYPFPNK